MKIAIVGAGFAPEEADRLRRAMATFKRNGDIHLFRDKFVRGMLANGYSAEFATRCFDQIEGFGTYGFPESHAASFALLVYVSAWIKCFYPDVFACALLNSQPMGFYAPAQIVRDAREHGVAVRPVDVNFSEWDCTLEPPQDNPLPRGRGRKLALRLGLRQVKGLAEADAMRLVAARDDGPSRREQGSRLSGGASAMRRGYRDAPDLWRRSGLGRAALERLAAADALRSLDRCRDGLDRRRGLWALQGLGEPPLPLFAAAETGKKFPLSPGGGEEPSRRDGEESENHAASLLPEMPLGEQVVEDYATLGLTIKRHPLAFLRAELAQQGLVCAADLATLSVGPQVVGRRVAIAGLVLIRQRPGSANGVVFVTLEDETGIANLIVWPATLERFRRAALGATLLYCRGRLQREESVIHVVAEDLADWTARLATLRERTGEPAQSLPDGSASPRGGRPPVRNAADIVIPSRDFR